MKSLIILVMTMVMAIIFTDSTFYYNNPLSSEMGLRIFNNLPSINDAHFQELFDIYWTKFEDTTAPIVFLSVGNDFVREADVNPDNLRDEEKITINENCSDLFIGTAFDGQEVLVFF